jgi:hypothetical protein
MIPRRRLLKFGATLVPGLILFACASPPSGIHYVTDGEGLITGDGLHRVKYWNAGAAFVRPGASMAQYDKVIVGEITVKYQRPPNLANESASILARDNYEFSPSVMKSIQRRFGEAIEEVFSDSEKISFTKRPAANTFVIFGHIVDLSVTAPPFKYQRSDTTVYAGSMGAATLFLDVRDLKTGESLVRTVTRSALIIDSAMGLRISNYGSNAMALRLLFERRINLLRLHLEELQELSEIPVNTAAFTRPN